MDVKKIESLAKLMKETGLTALELSEGETVLKLERKQEVIAAAPVAAVSAPVAGPEMLGVVSQEEPVQAQKEGTMVLSPTVGVFYASPSPDARPFGEVGDQEKMGDTLCIIEAMKLMNEIPAEVDGTIAEICVGNGQVVEYNQPLFRII